MIPLTSHSHTEIEESLLPDITEESSREKAKRRRVQGREKREEI
jgi:hypothetical protein